jgi:hypothetical protein
VNFEGQLARVHMFVNLTGVLRIAGGAFQIAQPFFHQAYDAIANRAGAIIEFQRSGGEKASAGKGFLFAVGEQVFAEGAEETEAAELGGGADNLCDEDVAGFVHDGALQILFGAEVGEEAALADAEGSGEFADGEAFQAFQGRDVDGFAEDGAAGFEAAGAAGWMLC